MMQIISTRRQFRRIMVLATTIIALTTGCGEPTSPIPQATPLDPLPTPASDPAIRVVVLGDSLAAGLGLAQSEAFPAIMESLLREDGFDVEIVNAGVSGDTTAGGLSRLDWVLQHPTEVLIVELGGNDALRGQPLENTEKNLRSIIQRGRESGAEVVLLGMDVPTNYGPDYATAFSDLYTRIAEDEGITLVAGFVRELGADPNLLQPDGLHPTAEGQRKLALAIHPFLVDLLDPSAEAISSPEPL